MILDQFVEVPPISPLLTCCQGNIYFLTQNREVLLEALGAYRVFDEKRR